LIAASFCFRFAFEWRFIAAPPVKISVPPQSEEALSNVHGLD
jgi:hypothetical protein